VQVHPLTEERAIVLGHFARKLLDVSLADSGHLFAMLHDHMTRLENTVRWRWSGCGHLGQPRDSQGHRRLWRPRRIVRRVTIDGPVSVGIDGRHGRRCSGATQFSAAA
jgi:alpha-ketoglutarate-dependent sulfate ester dioxygenase